MNHAFSHLVHFDPETHQWVDRYAIAKDMSREEVIQRLIRMGIYALEDEEKNLAQQSSHETEISPRIKLSVQASVESLLILQKAHLSSAAEIEAIRQKAKSIIKSSLQAIQNQEKEDLLNA